MLISASSIQCLDNLTIKAELKDKNKLLEAENVILQYLKNKTNLKLRLAS